LYKLTCTHKSALRAIRFKYHDRLQQLPIGFQSTTLETTQNDERFYAYRRSVALDPITSSTRSKQGAGTQTHTRAMHQRVSKSKGLPIDVHLCFYYSQHAHRCVQKVRGYRSTYLSTSITSSMCIAAYKKQGDPDRRSVQLLLLFIRVFNRAQKARGSTGLCSKSSTQLTTFSKVFTAQQISSSMI
jgi:hypothetical protein